MQVLRDLIVAARAQAATAEQRRRQRAFAAAFCTCPDDCSCHRDHVPTICGCTAHD